MNDMDLSREYRAMPEAESEKLDDVVRAAANVKLKNRFGDTTREQERQQRSSSIAAMTSTSDQEAKIAPSTEHGHVCPVPCRNRQAGMSLPLLWICHDPCRCCRFCRRRVFAMPA